MNDGKLPGMEHFATWREWVRNNGRALRDSGTAAYAPEMTETLSREAPNWVIQDSFSESIRQELTRMWRDDGDLGIPMGPRQDRAVAENACPACKAELGVACLSKTGTELVRPHKRRIDLVPRGRQYMPYEQLEFSGFLDYCKTAKRSALKKMPTLRTTIQQVLDAKKDTWGKFTVDQILELCDQ